MKTESTYRLKDTVPYFLMLFVVLGIINLLMGGIYRPVIAYFQGEAVDFGAYWQEANLTSRLVLAFIIALLFALNKYRRERKRVEKV
jgi:F0F1-type ATP synthase membrane subunit a